MKKFFFLFAIVIPVLSFARDTSYVECMEGSDLRVIAEKFNELTDSKDCFHTITFEDRVVTIKNQKLISGLTVLEDGKYSNGQRKIVVCGTISGEALP